MHMSCSTSLPNASAIFQLPQARLQRTPAPTPPAAQYAIVGSANINQRSLDGARDTELAIGHFQPFYTHRTSDGPTVKGQVSMHQP